MTRLSHVFEVYLLLSIVLLNLYAYKRLPISPVGRISRLHSICSEAANSKTKLESVEIPNQLVLISENAKAKLKELKKDSPELYLRIGVKKGGCSGLSYVMEIVDENTVGADDHVEKCSGINCIVDAKSLLFLYGLHLDFSDELIGGGFKFTNPNAQRSW